MAPVHERDIADVATVAAAVLTGTAEEKIRNLLTGGELLSQRSQVDLIGEAIGTPSVARRCRRSRSVPTRGSGLETVDAILQLIVDATDGGSPSMTTAQEIPGRTPASLAGWADEHAAGFR